MATYIHRRNVHFKKKILKADKEKILGVAIDPSRHFHRVLIFNFTGKLLIDPFSIDVFKTGYKELKDQIANCSRRIGALEVYIGIEGAASYSENLIRHMLDDYGNVVFMAPNTVAANRKQRLMEKLKTDDIDAGAVADLLIRGEFKKYYAERGVYFELKELVYWRERKKILLVASRNQIINRLEKIYPGITISYGEHKKLFANPEEDKLYNGLIQYRKTGKKLLETPSLKLLKIFGYKMRRDLRRIEKLKSRLEMILLPDEKIAKEQLKILEGDVNFMLFLQNQISDVEEKIIKLAKQTPAKYIMNQIGGVTEIQSAIYLGLIGDIRQYRAASDIFAKSGLCPKVEQSGIKNRTPYGIRRTGSKLLRTHLFRMALFAMLNEPVFQDYYDRKRKKNIDKHWKKIRIAVANKLNRVLFALIRDRSEFDSVKVKPLESSNLRLGHELSSSSEQFLK